MGENPDLKNPEHENFPPQTGDLRFVQRLVDPDDENSMVVRILQRYEWSYTLADHGWFDVPLAEEK